jgi:hypothetical protein
MTAAKKDQPRKDNPDKKQTDGLREKQDDPQSDKAKANSKPGNKEGDQLAKADPNGKQSGIKDDKNGKQAATKADPSNSHPGDSQEQPDPAASGGKAQQPQENQSNKPSS